MTIKVNEHILIVPPYLSTTWDQIACIQTNDDTLIVRLYDETVLKIPGLSSEIIATIFEFHASYLEKLSGLTKQQMTKPSKESMLEKLMNLESNEPGLQIAFSNMDGLGTALIHNPEQSASPNLPKEVLQKISAISKIIANESDDSLPKAVPGCNCFYCQLANAMNPQENIISVEEQISDEELKFQEWDIQSSGVQLYTVINKLDDNEKYTVFLGHPIGCTCGKSNCEHIVAVLKS